MSTSLFNGNISVGDKKEAKLIANFHKEYYKNKGDTRVAFSDIITHNSTTATNGTMVDSDGLLKWRPHNLATYSEDISQSAWTKSANVTISGTDKIVPNNGATSSLYIFKNLNTIPELFGQTFANTNYLVNLNDGSYSVVVGTFDSFSVTPDGSSFVVEASLDDVTFRVKLTKGEWEYSAVQFFNTNCYVYATESPGGSTGDGVSGIYATELSIYRSDLGGMVNNPDTGNSYVPTTTAARYLPRRGHHVYDGSEWVNEGLLVESEARVNLIDYSNDLSQWSNFNSTDAQNVSGVAAPDGEDSANELIEDSSASNYHQVSFSNTVASATTHTFSVFAKRGVNTATRFLGLSPVNSTSAGNNQTAVFDLSAGTYEGAVALPSSPTGSGLSGSIQDVGNGWYRCTATVNAAIDTLTGSYNSAIRLMASADTAGLQYNGDSTQSIYIYGAQLEEGSTPSSYIPTSGATATRGAETLTVAAADLPWPTPKVIGPELVTNGTFDTDTDWTKGTGWTISGGVATHTVGTSSLVSTAAQIEAVAGDILLVEYTLSNVTGGSFRVHNDGLFASTNDTFSSANGTYAKTLIAAGSGILYLYANSAFAGSIDNISVKKINPLSVSIQMDGRMTYAEGQTTRIIYPMRWQFSTQNKIYPYFDSDSGVLDWYFVQEQSDIIDSVSTTSGSTPAGVLTPFNIASRHGSTFINGAVDGTALTADTTPVALPDLSATNLQLAYDYMGTIKSFRIWDKDIGDTYMEYITSGNYRGN